MTAESGRWPPYLPLALVVFLYLLAIVAVGPLREASFSDDWAYALTVRQWLESGSFRMHDWSASYAPWHIAWGAAYSSLFGYSFASLRVSTLVLMLLGLIAFYQLAREHDLTPAQAGILTLVLLSSPLVLGFSFTFMTDVPFLTYVTGALFLYTRAIRTRSVGLMMLGAIVAAAAVLTRQFGIAFVPGLLLLWLCDRDRRRNTPLIVAGIVLPALAAGWQAYAAAADPNWASTWVANRQVEYLADVLALIPRTLWRLTITLQYLALFCAPLLLPAIVDCIRWPRLRAPLLAALAIFALATTAYATQVLDAPLWPPLIPWNLEPLELWPLPARAAFTLAALIAGILFGGLLVSRYAAPSRWMALPLHQRLLDTVSFLLLGFQLVLFQFGDEYLLPLMPFALIAGGRQVRPWLDHLRRPIVALSLGVLVLSTLWTRATLAEIEAQWRGGEDLVAAGIPLDKIASPTPEWYSYHGTFDTYLADAGFPQDAEAYRAYSYRWLPARQRTAEYVIMRLPTRPKRTDVEVIKEIEFRDLWLRRRRVFVVKMPARRE